MRGESQFTLRAHRAGHGNNSDATCNERGKKAGVSRTSVKSGWIPETGVV